MKSDKRQILEALSTASNLGFTMVVNAAVGLLFGKAFDKWLDTAPWGVAIGVALGMIAGIRSLYRKAAELEDSSEKDKDKKNDTHG
jgi:F0F1-type ATP synthase assembly protein I